MVNYEREPQIDSTKPRIIEFGLDFVEKLKIEVERKFRAPISPNLFHQILISKALEVRN